MRYFFDCLSIAQCFISILSNESIQIDLFYELCETLIFSGIEVK
jgi:hypothetical protein